MGFMGIGTGELIVILAITALVVGPDKMVKWARDAGRLIAKLRQETESIRGEFAEALDVDVDDTVQEIKQIGQEARDIKSEIEGALDITGQARSRAARPSASARPLRQQRQTPDKSAFKSADQESVDAEPTELRGVELVPSNDQEAEAISLGGVTTIEEEQDESCDDNDAEKQREG